MGIARRGKSARYRGAAMSQREENRRLASRFATSHASRRRLFQCLQTEKKGGQGDGGEPTGRMCRWARDLLQFRQVYRGRHSCYDSQRAAVDQFVFQTRMPELCRQE